MEDDLAFLVFKYLFATSPIWVMFFLGYVFINMWMRYIRNHYIKKQDSVLFEIKLPREITKTPAAMEIFFTALYQSGVTTYYETYFDGKVRPWFSLELVSLGGQVKFFIWTMERFKDIVQSQLYAQYPNIEIYESPDYAKLIPFDQVNFPFWGTYFKLTKADAFPIKTYIDYGMDKLSVEEEYKIDPMTSVLEFLGSLKEGEQVWIQILMQAHRGVGLIDGYLFKKEDWKGGALNEIKKIRKKAEPLTPEGFPRMLMKSEQDAISAIERSLAKFPFEVMIRCMYIAKKGSFKGSNIPGLIGSFRQYSSNELNGFKLGGYTDLQDKTKDFLAIFKFKIFQDIADRYVLIYKKRMLDGYKKRSFFQYPQKNYRMAKGPFILTTEELATIFHFPGEVAQTPTFERILSKKAEAPPNLPI